jgi:hypothetical protein
MAGYQDGATSGESGATTDCPDSAARKASSERSAAAPRKRFIRAKDDRSYTRSRISNGSTLLPNVDGRNTWVRRARDVIAELVSDLGGLENVSAQERSIVRRAAALTVELERLEARFALADAANSDDLDLYARASGGLRRLLESVGLERRARLVNRPSISQIIERYASRGEQDGEVAP